VTECTLQRPWEKITRKTEAAVLSGSGGRIRSSDVREWNNTIVCANERGSSAGSNCRFVGRLEEERLGGGLFPTVSFATSLMKKIDGDGKGLLAITLVEMFY